MTTKTARTLALIDRMAGVTDIRGGRSDKLVVPMSAWYCYQFRQPRTHSEWWQLGRGKYDSGLLFKITHE